MVCVDQPMSTFLRQPRPNVVLMEAYRGSGDGVVTQQSSRSPRVLGSNGIDFSQDPKGAKRHVLHVAERGCDHEQRAGHRVWT